MLNFQKYLVEVFGSNFDYKLPVDKEQQLYDFFMLSFIFNSKDKKVPKNPNEADKVNYAVAEVRDKLLPVLQKQMLDAVFFSVCAEVRHLLDFNTADELMKIVEEELGGKYVAVLKAFIKDFTVRSHKQTQGLLRRPDTSNFVEKGNRKDYKQAFHSAIKASPVLSDIVEIAQVLFKKANWGSMYGGTPWSNIAKGWLQLKRAKTPNDQMVWIDHVYDLQHNTGSVFTKVESYAKQGGFSWLKNALDYKRDIKLPHALLDKVSPSLKTLALRVLKRQFGYGYDQYLKDQEPKKYVDNDPNNDKDWDAMMGKKPYTSNPDDVKLDLTKPNPSGWQNLKDTGEDQSVKNLVYEYFGNNNDLDYILSFAARKHPQLNLKKLYDVAKTLGYGPFNFQKALEDSLRITNSFKNAIEISTNFKNIYLSPNVNEIIKLYKLLSSLSFMPFKNTSLWDHLITNYDYPFLSHQDKDVFNKYKEIFIYFSVIDSIKETGFDTEYKIWTAVNKAHNQLVLPLDKAIQLLSTLFPEHAAKFQSNKANKFTNELEYIDKTLNKYHIGSGVYAEDIEKLKKFVAEIGNSTIINSILSVIDTAKYTLLQQLKKVREVTGLSLLDSKLVTIAGVAFVKVTGYKSQEVVKVDGPVPTDDLHDTVQKIAKINIQTGLDGVTEVKKATAKQMRDYLDQTNQAGVILKDNSLLNYINNNSNSMEIVKKIKDTTGLSIYDANTLTIYLTALWRYKNENSTNKISPDDLTNALLTFRKWIDASPHSEKEQWAMIQNLKLPLDKFAAIPKPPPNSSYSTIKNAVGEYIEKEFGINANWAITVNEILYLIKKHGGLNNQNTTTEVVPTAYGLTQKLTTYKQWASTSKKSWNEKWEMIEKLKIPVDSFSLLKTMTPNQANIYIKKQFGIDPAWYRTIANILNASEHHSTNNLNNLNPHNDYW